MGGSFTLKFFFLTWERLSFERNASSCASSCSNCFWFFGLINIWIIIEWICLRNYSNPNISFPCQLLRSSFPSTATEPAPNPQTLSPLPIIGCNRKFNQRSSGLRTSLPHSSTFLKMRSYLFYRHPCLKSNGFYLTSVSPALRSYSLSSKRQSSAALNMGTCVTFASTKHTSRPCIHLSSKPS